MGSLVALQNQACRVGAVALCQVRHGGKRDHHAAIRASFLGTVKPHEAALVHRGKAHLHWHEGVVQFL